MTVFPSAPRRSQPHDAPQETRPGGRARFDALAGLPTPSGLGDGAVKQGDSIGGDIWAVKSDTLVHLEYALPIDIVDPDPVLVPLLSEVLARV